MKGVKSRLRLIVRVGLILLQAPVVRAEMRTWNLRSGATVRGEYVTTAFDRIILRDAENKRITYAFSEVSEEDMLYVELANPPALKVDLLKSESQVFVKPSPFVNNSPANVMRYRFGARIKQTDFRDYQHDLIVEIYAVSRQVYDPDKYRLILKWKSVPFRLSAENERRVEMYAPGQAELSDFLLSRKYPRGQEFAETLIAVRDERGIIISCNATKNWLSNNLDKLEALPEGAWFDKTCRRVHPTSPKAVWFN